MAGPLLLLDAGYVLDTGWYLDSLLAGSSGSYEWLTDFATPVALTGLVLTPDPDTASILATVTASSDAHHEAYIWETVDEDGQWVEIERTADPELTWRLARHNEPTRMRVSDWTGAADASGLSESIADETTLTEMFWWMVHVDGDGEFTTALRHVLIGITTEDPLDQVVLQPLSGPSGEMQVPIVITGQRQGERLALTIRVAPSDAPELRLLQRAARLPVGSIALKDPKGPVHIVALTGSSVTDLGAGHRSVAISAIRVA